MSIRRQKETNMNTYIWTNITHNDHLSNYDFGGIIGSLKYIYVHQRYNTVRDEIMDDKYKTRGS